MFLKKRLGFIKLAMQHGAAIVPCYAFGTVDLYDITPAQVRKEHFRSLEWVSRMGSLNGSLEWEPRAGA